MIKGGTYAFSGFADYAGHGHAANPDFPWLGRWFVLVAPVVAGLLYGPLVYRFAKEARGHGVPEVMVAVARNGGRIRPQVALVKSVASALCIAGGGSVGREGPIVQIGSALGSSLAQAFRLDEKRVKLLVACGAAGGIAATFNAPLAGVFFAMEIILREFETEAFGMVVLSSVTASVIGRGILGNNPFLVLPTFHIDHLVQYPLFALLGVVAGVVGVAFSRVLYAIEDAVRLGLARAGVGAPGGRRAAARRRPAGAAGDVRRRLPRARQGRGRRVRHRVPARAARRQARSPAA